MSNYGWTNEAGEPIMDGAAYRFEQQLDMESAHERYLDDDEFFGDDEPSHYDFDWDDLDSTGMPWCYGCDDYAHHGVADDDEPFVMEDQWLDGSYEE
jgi:hypothetical protein